MSENPYIRDIRSQPDALQAALDGFDSAPCRALFQDLQRGRFDRILLSGMGSSTYGTYPLWLELVRHGLPAWTVETAELLHYARDLITSRTLLWLTSQSGQTAEVLALLEELRGRRPAFVLATSNDPTSPLALGADAALLLRAGEEATVSTKTYLNTLALTQLAGLVLCGEPVEGALEELARLVGEMRAYLSAPDERVGETAQAAGQIQRLFLLGRGPSMATVETGALILKESTKFPVAGLGAGQFRHGPLELADAKLTTIIMEGQAGTAELNRRLGRELAVLGARVLWVGAQPPEGARRLPSLPAAGAALPLAEMLPVQMVSIVLARQNGFEPGVFRNIQKVTYSE